MADEVLPNEPEQKRGRQRKRRILDEARELFEERGYERTRIEDLAARADASPGLFYRYFASKRQVLLVLMDEYLEALSALRIDGVDLAPDPVAITEALLTRSVSAESRYAGLWRAWREAVRVDPTLQPLHASITRWMTDYTASVVRAAQRDGVASSELDAEAVAFAATSLVWTLAELDPVDQKRLLPDMAKLLVRAIQPQ